MSKSKEIIDAELDATQLLGRWSNFRFFGNRQAARHRRVRIRTRKCRTQSGPLKCRRNLDSPLRAAVRARYIGFEPVSAVVFWTLD
jgi:hypothetical protein